MWEWCLVTVESQPVVQGMVASDPVGWWRNWQAAAASLRVLAASRLFPVVRSGSHTFCHLEPPPDLTGPMGLGGPSKTQLWDGEYLSVLPPFSLPPSTPDIAYKWLVWVELGGRGHLNPELSWGWWSGFSFPKSMLQREGGVEPWSVLSGGEPPGPNASAWKGRNMALVFVLPQPVLNLCRPLCSLGLDSHLSKMSHLNQMISRRPLPAPAL